ncbi:MAG: hypothetical protein ACYC7A_08960 [Thermoanaerobaculia bacterium]
MTTFIRLLGAALGVFLLLGGIQEWRSLGKGIFLPDKPAAEMSKADRTAAARTVYTFAQLSSHFYGSGGDRRFAERFPATPSVIDEIQRDASYVAHNGRIEEPALMRLEVTSVQALAADRVEVHTKEYWTTRYVFTATGRQESLRSDIIKIRYRVARDGAAWRIVSWDPEEEE